MPSHKIILRDRFFVLSFKYVRILKNVNSTLFPKPDKMAKQQVFHDTDPQTFCRDVKNTITLNYIK